MRSKTMSGARHRSMPTDRGKDASRPFFDGFLDGLGSAAFVVESERPRRRRYTGTGAKGDWQAVGQALRKSMSANKAD